MPNLTVMMPARNAASTIEAALDSTLRALPPDSEIVVFNDASTDRTGEIAESHPDRRVRVIHNVESSVGGGEARQAMMRASDSKYISSMDADDLCFRGRFRVELEAIITSDVIFGAAIWFGSSAKQLRATSPFPYSPSDSRAALLFHCPFAHPSMLARREALESVGGYSNISRAQDYELWLRVAAANLRIRRLGRYVIGYRQSENQVIRQPDFASGVRNNKVLWSSYRALAASMSLGDHWQHESSATIGEAEREQMFRDLEKLAAQMSVGNRLRYQRYARARVATLIGAPGR